MHRVHPSKRLRRAAITILFVGGMASLGVWLSAHHERELPEFGSGSIAETRELQQLERLGGKASVLILKFQQWFESLWHGQRLAVTLIVLSVLVAALCWHLASLADEEDQ